MSEEFDLSLMWKIFKDLNSQQNILGVDNFEDTLREFIRLVEEEINKFGIHKTGVHRGFLCRKIDELAGKKLTEVSDDE